MRNRTSTVRYPIYSNFEVRIVFTEDVPAYGKSRGFDIADADAACLFDVTHPSVRWVVINYDASPGTVAHEASHAVRAILEFIGAGIDDEVFAYHLGHLVDKIFSFRLKLRSEEKSV